MSELSKKRVLFSDKARKLILGFPDLIYTGNAIKCKVCNVMLMCKSKQKCEIHVNSKKHRRNKNYSGFMFELCRTLILCNLPFNLLNNEAFRSFWNEYGKTELPGRTTVQSVLPSVREHLECRIKSNLKSKKLWLSVDETTDCKKNSVVIIMVRTMEAHQPSPSILLACRRVQKCTAEKIAQLVLNTLEHFEVCREQLLLFVSDGAATMLSVGRFLKKNCANLLHVTCKINALHLVVETIRRCYPEVDTLIASTKAVFLKSQKRVGDFHRLCPDILEPPQPILTHWGTWLQAAFYYNEHFESIRNVVLQFNPKETAAIQESQSKFQDSLVKTDLNAIQSNYGGLVDAIQKLENPSMALLESLQIVKDVHAQLCAVEGEINQCVTQQFESVLERDPDFGTLKQIVESRSTELLSPFKDYFNYANITSVDVECSFSKYKHIFSPIRTRFAESTVETHLMLQIFK